MVAFGLFGGAAQAATVFSENFDHDRTGSKRNFTNFQQFTVSDGSVDYLRSGINKLSCVGGTGGCVDLDGSTLDAGVMTSTAFAISAGTQYTFSFDLAGNGRHQAADSVTFGITGGLFAGALNNIVWNQPYTTYSYSFTAAQNGTASFFIGTAGGDYYGPLLDNVLVTSADMPVNMPVVPLPATLPLLAGAIGAAALLRRRKA